jgi:predicted permease
LEIVMSRFPRLARVRSLWRNLVRRGRAEGALDEEVRGAVALIVERKMRGGLSREEAQRAAALEFGAVEAVKQQVRDVRSGAAVESLLQDVRYAWRALRRSPLFAVTAAASLALGVAGNALVFSLLDAWLLQNRPGLSETSRLVEVGRVDSREGPGTYGGDGFDTFSYPTYLDVRARQRVFDGLAAYQSGVTFGLGAGDSSDKVSGAYVSANYFDVLGVRIALGRGFTPDEEQMGNPRAVVVISDQVWRRQFSGAPDVVGRTLRLNGRPFTIVGVTAPEFAGASIDRTEIWVPITGYRDGDDLTRIGLRGRQWLMGIGRLRPGVTITQARSDMARIAREIVREHPGEYVRHGLDAEPLGPLPVALRPYVNRSLALLFGFFGLVLLIAAFNVAGLLLARGASRASEIGVRLALGGPRRRVVRLLLLESLIVAVAGAGAGLATAWAALTLLTRSIPPMRIDLTFDVGLTWRVAVFALLVATATGVACALAPAWAATRIDLTAAIARANGATRRLRGRSAFVAAQVALSAVFVVCALLFGRSLRHAGAIDRGFALSDVEALSIDLRLAGYDEARGAVFMRELESRLATLPGVRASALARVAPLTGEREGGRSWLPGQFGDANAIQASQNMVTPGYFRTLGLTIVAGRNFTAADGPTGRVAIVNETLAKHAWPGASAVGKRLEVGSGRWPLEIIGVVRDAKYRTIGEAPTPFFYVPAAQRYDSIMWILWRPQAGSAMAEVRAALRSLDPQVPATQSGRLEELSAFLLFPQRMAAWLAAIVGVVGVLLAAVGVYGLSACEAVQRRREIGIRLALGGERSLVLRTIMRHAMRLAVIGAVLGLLGATAAGRLLEGLLYDLRGIDPLSFAGAAIVVLITTFVASLIPALRAASISPVEALHRE